MRYVLFHRFDTTGLLEFPCSTARAVGAELTTAWDVRGCRCRWRVRAVAWKVASRKAYVLVARKVVNATVTRGKRTWRRAI